MFSWQFHTIFLFIAACTLVYITNNPEFAASAYPIIYMNILGAIYFFILGGFSLGEFILNPSFAIKTSFFAIERSWDTISNTKSSNEVEASHPNSFDAFDGLPRRVSTSQGLKYLESILTTISPVSAL